MDNCIQLKCLLPFHYRFMFVDTEDYLSAKVFAEQDIAVRHVRLFAKNDNPFRLIVCCIRKRDIELFNKCMRRLDNNILLFGYKGYSDICKLMKGAEAEVVTRLKNGKAAIRLRHTDEDTGKVYGGDQI